MRKSEVGNRNQYRKWIIVDFGTNFGFTGTAPGALNSDPSTSNNNNSNSNNNTSSNNNSTSTSSRHGVGIGTESGATGPPGTSSSMAGTSQANWSSPPPGATLNYTANQSTTAQAASAAANNSNVTNEWNYGNSQRASQQRTEAQGLLSTSPMPEFWCSILYFELDTQVRALTRLKFNLSAWPRARYSKNFFESFFMTFNQLWISVNSYLFYDSHDSCKSFHDLSWIYEIGSKNRNSSKLQT